MVVLSKQSNYNRSEIKQNLERELTVFGGFKNLLNGKKSVLLKPNFVIPELKEGGSTTHPDFYMAIAEMLLELGFEVGIGDSPAFGSCAKALKFHGVYEECLSRNIKIVEFKHVEKFTPDNESLAGNLTIAAELAQWNSIINLPKLKVHQQFVFTGASKNLYGCVVGKRKFYRHNVCKNDPVLFARMILENAQKAGCLLHIGDGIEAMHVKGPRGGKVYPLGKIIIADNFLEHDWIFCHLIGLNPQSTPLFQACDKETLASLAKNCQKVLNSPCFSVAENFILSYKTDISFSPWHLLRTTWRSLKFKFKQV